MKKRRLLWGVPVVIAAVLLACVWYLNDYYRTDEVAVSAFVPISGVSRQEMKDGTLVFVPDEPAAGLIFYPGGKVEYTAYEPLLESCAAEGILCVLVEMPFNLAVLDMDAAQGIPEQFPEIKRWYLGGHSLGGSMAAAYLEEHQEDYAGLVLLGSYSTADLSDSALEVLSVYGSEDTVLNREKYEQYRTNLPDDFSEVVIEGGCHSQFGMYGPQNGDGEPTISVQQQISLTVQEIVTMVFPND